MCVLILKLNQFIKNNTFKYGNMIKEIEIYTIDRFKKPPYFCLRSNG